ncbi:helicase-related protein, partial [Desulfonatronospira sp.]|uniref:DEAD/DEAH box helicase n=1 Tax=Desulfonatronospira sp. TaxID=1962951 RepID=UPI0025C67F82
FHFSEHFQLMLPGDVQGLGRMAPAISRDFTNADSQDNPANPWRLLSQVVIPLDSFKPLDNRQGMSREQVEAYNQERFESLISAGWDMIIVDEAHKLGGSTDQVARFRFGQGLTEAAPYLLLLTATPHQGKTEAFYRLMSLLDSRAFPNVNSVSRERVQPFVIRTEKRRAIDAEGNPLFKPRRTELVPVSWEKAHHAKQQKLYHAVTEYARLGYNQAVQNRRNAIGFLMILLQRLMSSSVRAIRTTLERRLDALTSSQARLQAVPDMTSEDLAETDVQELIEVLLGSAGKALQNEKDEVQALLDAAMRCEQAGPDAKAEAFLEKIYALQAEEGEPELKVLVFTEFVSTQGMLLEFLKERGFQVVAINGSMSLEERKSAEHEFAGQARIMVSTDAGGEGLNLQFCHVVINYDIPWNPMRLEQRIGRVDRIGQKKTVRALNFVFENSVEHRVREVLEEKLSVIFQDLGIDKTGDVLDSAQAEEIFDDLYVQAILNPADVEKKVEQATEKIREQALANKESESILGSTQNLNPEAARHYLSHPLPHWVERMTVHYLTAYGGRAENKGSFWNLIWPGDDNVLAAAFTARDAEIAPQASLLTLENSRIRALAMRLPCWAPGQPLPVTTIPGAAASLQGVWSLWRIAIITQDWKKVRIMPLFIDDQGKNFSLSARNIWDLLLSAEPVIHDYLGSQSSYNWYEYSSRVAEKQGQPQYHELLQEHESQLSREQEKMRYYFAARRKIIESIGLPEVRAYRFRKLEQEEQASQAELQRKAEVLPEIEPLLMLRIQGEK